LVKCNSDPKLLNTIKVPRDLKNLKGLLPSKKYKNEVNKENNLPVLNTDVSTSVLQNVKLREQPSHITRVHSQVYQQPTSISRADSRQQPTQVSRVESRQQQRPESKQNAYPLKDVNPQPVNYRQNNNYGIPS